MEIIGGLNRTLLGANYQFLRLENCIIEFVVYFDKIDLFLVSLFTELMDLYPLINGKYSSERDIHCGFNSNIFSFFK